MTLNDIASWIGGTVSGDGSTIIHRATSLDHAKAGDLTLVDGKKNMLKWASSPATAAVVNLDFPDDARPLIRVAKPLDAFLVLLVKLRGDRSYPTGIHHTAIIHPSVKIGENPTVGPNAMIGEGSVVGANAIIHPGAVIGRYCTFGDDVVIHANAVLYDDCVLGHRVIIHSNAVIGADGYGYKQVAGKHIRVPQLGNVIIEDDVEIGANSTVDRGTIGPTVIGTGTKIDNLVMISHNCQIGRHNLIVGQVGIAGSSSTGDYVILAGQVGIADHVHIGNHTVLAAQTGVTSDIPEKSQYMGYPALPMKEYLRMVVNYKKVAEMREQLKLIEADLRKLKGEA
jgi:UDP-3-O-[3-hydroxymyristoyl] glucosamine N-acyltransferase